MPKQYLDPPEALCAGGKRLSVEDAAVYIGLSVSTLNKMRIWGNGPKYLKLGRRILYDTTQLDNWMADKLRSKTSDARTAEAA